MVKTFYASRASSSPPSKRLNSDAPSASRPRSDCQVIFQEMGAPIPSLAATLWHSKASLSTAVGVKTLVRFFAGTRPPFSYPVSSFGSMSVLQDLNLANE